MAITFRDPDTLNEIPVSAANPLPVNATVTATANTVAVATAAAPAYTEGSTDSLSMDLNGNLRIGGTINASTAATAGSSDPIYSAGAQALSQDLSGYLRVKAKQSGTWAVGIDQTTPGATNAVDVTNFPVTVATNAGAADANTIRAVLATGGATVPVSGTFWQATQPVSIATMPSTPVTGTFWQATQPVSLASVPSHAVTNVGTFAVQAAQSGTWNIGTVTTITGVTTAFGAPASSVPASSGYNGLRGTTANPTAVTDGQLVGAMADKMGRAVVVLGAVRDLVAQQLTTITGTTETTIVTAVASTFLDLVGLKLTNSGTTAVEVAIRDATAGTIIDYLYVPAGDMRGVTYTVPFKQTTANSNWTAQASAATTSLRVTAQFVKNL